MAEFFDDIYEGYNNPKYGINALIKCPGWPPYTRSFSIFKVPALENMSWTRP